MDQAFFEKKINQKAVMSDRSQKKNPNKQTHHIFSGWLIAFILLSYKQFCSTKERRNKQMFIMCALAVVQVAITKHTDAMGTYEMPH